MSLPKGCTPAPWTTDRAAKAQTISVRFATATFDKLRALAMHSDRSVGYIVRMAVNEYIAKQVKHP